MKSSAIKSSSALKAAVFFAVLAIGALVALTERFELLVLLGVPIALILLRSHRLAVIALVWAMAIWTSRLPVVLFDFVRFSYVVYACVAITAAAYGLKLLTFGARAAPFIGKTAWGAWLLLFLLVVGGPAWRKARVGNPRLVHCRPDGRPRPALALFPYVRPPGDLPDLHGTHDRSRLRAAAIPDPDRGARGGDRLGDRPHDHRLRRRFGPEPARVGAARRARFPFGARLPCERLRGAPRRGLRPDAGAAARR